MYKGSLRVLALGAFCMVGVEECEVVMQYHFPLVWFIVFRYGIMIFVHLFEK